MKIGAAPNFRTCTLGACTYAHIFQVHAPIVQVLKLGAAPIFKVLRYVLKICEKIIWPEGRRSHNCKKKKKKSNIKDSFEILTVVS